MISRVDQSAILSCFFPLPPSLSYSFLPFSPLSFLLPFLPPSLPFTPFFTSTNIHRSLSTSCLWAPLSKLLSTTLLDFCDPLLQTQIGSCCPCMGQGRKLLAPQGENQAVVSIRWENGMMKGQNNEGPVYIHSAITYLLEVILCAKRCSRSWEFKDQTVGLSPQRASNLAKER